MGMRPTTKPKPPLSATGVNVTAISVAVMALASAATVLLTIKRRQGLNMTGAGESNALRHRHMSNSCIGYLKSA